MTEVAGCEQLLPNNALCNVVAIGRCLSCRKAFCGTHQALTKDIFQTPYKDFCTTCQRKREEAARAKQLDTAIADTTRRLATWVRIDQLLTEFRKRPLSGAQDRSWIEVVNKGRKRFGSGYHLEEVQHTEELAVPIGKLRWTSYLSYDSEGTRKVSEYTGLVETGLTRAGEFVRMDVKRLHGDRSYGHKLEDRQEEEICSRLERLLQR